MLEYLKLENVGPAPRMEIEFAPRVNLITGDNGLGKSFLLDNRVVGADRILAGGNQSTYDFRSRRSTPRSE